MKPVFAIGARISLMAREARTLLKYVGIVKSKKGNNFYNCQSDWAAFEVFRTGAPQKIARGLCHVCASADGTNRVLPRPGGARPLRTRLLAVAWVICIISYQMRGRWRLQMCKIFVILDSSGIYLEV
jgi:hypothetical protein